MAFGLLLASFFLSFFFRTSASVVLPRLATDWGLSAAVTGLISSLYFYAYALIQPICGALNDRFGPMRVAAVGLSIASLGAICFALARNALLLAVGRLLTGLGLSSMLSGTVAFQNASSAPERYVFFSGLTYFVGNLGAVASVAPLGAALDAWGRRRVFSGLCLVTIVVAAALYIMRNHDPVTAINAGRRGSSGHLWHELKNAMAMIRRSPNLRAIVMIWPIAYGSLMTMQGLWAVEWCQSTYGATDSAARIWATLISIGVMVGNLAGARIGREMRHRRRAISISSLSYALSWSTLWIGMAQRWPMPITGSIVLHMGVCVGVCATHLAAGVSNTAQHGRGGALFGLVNMFPSLGVIFAQWGTGLLLSRKAIGTLSTTGTQYPASAFLFTFAIVVGVVWISQLALLTMEEFSRNS